MLGVRPTVKRVSGSKEPLCASLPTYKRRLGRHIPLRVVYPGWYGRHIPLRVWYTQGVVGCIYLSGWYTQGVQGVLTSQGGIPRVCRVCVNLSGWYTQGVLGRLTSQGGIPRLFPFHCWSTVLLPLVIPVSLLGSSLPPMGLSFTPFHCWAFSAPSPVSLLGILLLPHHPFHCWLIPHVPAACSY